MDESFYIPPAPVACTAVVASSEHRTDDKVMTVAIVTSGHALVRLDGKENVLYEGGVFVLLPRHLVELPRPEECTAQCLFLSFSFDFMTDFPYILQAHVSKQIEEHPALQLLPEEYDRLRRCFDDIVRHAPRRDHPSYLPVLRSYIFVFVAEVSNFYTRTAVNPVSSYKERLTGRFFSLLHEQLYEHRDVAHYAGCLCITYKHLTRVVHQVTGSPPSYWLAYFTVRELKALLRSTDYTVTELAERMHFSSSSSLAAFFRKHTGMSPGEYRQQG